MKIKKFVGNSIHETMRQVKQEMGANAVILHTRSIRPNKFFGLFKKEKVEITAAVEKASIQPAYESQTASFQPQISEITNQIYQVQEMMSEMKNQLELNQTTPSYPKNLQKIYQQLLMNQVDAKIAKGLLRKITENYSLAEQNNSEVCESYLVSLVEDILNNVSPIVLKENKMKVVGLIGPTGVGKTTTIAKLAAHFSILKKKQVALITVDTYRIAAVEQLKTYGEIIGIPVDVVFTPSEMKESLDKFKKMELILVDTAGRSHKNHLHMSELKRYLTNLELEEMENILVLSATGKNEDMYEIVEKYNKQVNIDKIIFTKLDETSSLGSLVNICNNTKKPLSYLTTGQNVPDDIELANPRRLANLIVKGRIV